MQKNLSPNNKADQGAVFEQTFDFVVKNKLVFGAGAGALLVVAILITVLTSVNASNFEKANRFYDLSLNNLNNISTITNTQDRAKFYQEQINNLNRLTQMYPNTTPSIRAHFLLGRIFFEDSLSGSNPDSINMAIGYYNGAFESAKTGFYKTLALVGRAQCYEQKGDYQKAFDDFQTVATLYSKEGLAALAMLGMARNKEMTGDMKAALELYQKLSKDYPASTWSKIARGKIYYFSDPNNVKKAAPSLGLTNKEPYLFKN
jgi:tetratricopeptide (TPR) repeat protein